MAKGGGLKAILIIADGLGGRPGDVGGRTCLEAARVPNLDELARRGATGMVDPIGPGIRPGSDAAHLSLLGYDLREVYTGRGVFECLGMGMKVGPGDVSFRANFATVERVKDGFRLLDRRAGRIDSGQEELAKALNAIRLRREPGIEVEFRPSTEHRGAFVLRGESLSRHVTDTDPHEVATVVPESRPVGVADEAAWRTAAALNEFTQRSFEVLDDHPANRKREGEGKLKANLLLLRGASDLARIEPIEKRYGVKGAVIAGGALYRGIGLACGMERIDAPGATGGLDTDLCSKAKTALAALERLDYVFVHVKGTDTAGHDHQARAKVEFIERIDAELIGSLARGVDWERTHLAFTGDHTTPIDYGDHATDPVPVLFVGPNVRPDGSRSFGEREAAHGGLSRFSGQVLPILFGYNNWSPKFGS